MLQPHETWNILDSTKIGEYQACARRYLFERIFGWQPEEPSIHLVHGSSWHLSMRHMLRNKTWDAKTIMEAYNLYEKEYRKSFPDADHDAENHPKNPSMTHTALLSYAKEFRQTDAQEEVLHTEIGGSVMLMDDVTISFKMDSILRDHRGILSREHKTASRLDDKWKMKWKLGVQVGTYLHVLFCLYPPNEVVGVEINGSFWHKKDITFFRQLERRRIEAMEAWRSNTLSWIYSIKADTHNFMQEEDSDVLVSFRQNPEFCTQYFGCIYHPYCSAWTNPLHHCDTPPLGFKIEHWNPMAEELEERISV